MTDGRPRLSNPWLVLTTLLFIYIFNFADRFLITGLVGPIKAEFAVGDGTMGLLMGPAFVLLYVLLGVPLARLADRGSRIRIIVGGCLLWSVATAATGLAKGVVALALARAAVGIGEAAFVAPAYSLLSDYFRAERRGLAFAILGLATYFGQMAGQAGGPAIAAHFGDWRLAFIFMGCCGVPLALAALALVREPPREQQGQAQQVGQIAFLDLVAVLIRTPAYLLLMFGFALGALSGVAFGVWGPELLTRIHALDPVDVKSAFAINFGVSGLLGMLAFGALSDRFARSGMHWPVRLSALAIASATLAVLAVLWMKTFTAAMFVAVPAGLLGGGWSVGLLATLQYILPARFRASATALFIAVTTVGGYFVAPWITGALSEALGDDAASLRMALTLVIPIGFAGAALAWIASAKVEAARANLNGARGEAKAVANESAQR
ncbi:spinster family MFS transporter [Novosphingobium panipatense]|uniref:spinster family MFS transporter n=1 Tax=Novosphingobium TaxID=165696 RepID=UPI000CDACBB1|nr:MFS transporter [Novosphingobium sp. HII-3]